MEEHHMSENKQNSHPTPVTLAILHESTPASQPGIGATIPSHLPATGQELHGLCDLPRLATRLIGALLLYIPSLVSGKPIVPIDERADQQIAVALIGRLGGE